MNDCWKKAQKYLQEQYSRVFAVGIENGLVEGKEIGREPKKWYDTCIVSVSEKSTPTVIAVQQGESVLTELGLTGQTFDEQVQKYHKIIMPKINSKIDLYIEWTKDFPGGPHTREYFIKNCLVSCILQLESSKKASEIVTGCATAGVVASVGLRYRNMIWMRDLAYMTPAYLRVGQEDAVIQALRTLCKQQCKEENKIHNNGYETIKAFGSMPIVCVPKEREREFLLQRIRGTAEDPYWQIQLWNYCKTHCKEKLMHFPSPTDDVQVNDELPPNLDNCTKDKLREYYKQLLNFRNGLPDKAPKPSFALRSFIKGNLHDITPGTRDSEIQFIRAICYLLGSADVGRQKEILAEFTKPLADSLFYLHMNVIDVKDGLPRGCDSRDIFADMLYDAKLLSNAVFWFESLSGLLQYCDILEKTQLRNFIKKNLNVNVNENCTHFLNRLMNEPFSEVFRNELAKVKKGIKEQLLFNKDTFSPRDFIPGERAQKSLVKAVNPTPSSKIVVEHNPEFVSGKNVDPQSLAHAVINGLIDEKYYDQVVKHFMEQDSKIGVTVFVPISGKTEEEAKLLNEVKGRVVWPHVSWAVVSALTKMGTVSAKLMASEQTQKLSNLGFGEWYAMNPKTKNKKPIQGGDPQQGWAARAMMLATQVGK